MTRTRTGSVYLAVVVVIAAVTILTLTGVALRKRINDQSVVATDASAAHAAARSGAELVIQRALSDRDGFHTLATTGSVFSNVPVQPGRVTARIRDAATDGAVVADTRRYAVVADAAAGQARSRLGFELLRPEDPLTLLIRAEPSAVAYWPLDEVEESVAVDRLNGRNGVYSMPHAAGARTHAHGNPAPSVDSKNDYVQVDHKPAFELRNGTLCFWVRFESLPVGNQEVAVVSKEGNSLEREISLAVWLDRTRRLSFMLNNKPKHGGLIQSDPINLNAWYFITISWGDAGMRLYVNGNHTSTNGAARVGLQRQYVFLYGWRDANKHSWKFGRRSQAADGPTNYASVARVSLFSTQLPGQKIRELYEATSMEPGFRVVPGSFARVVD